jgi:hypothetical protein
MGACCGRCLGADLDATFAYETQKMVLVKDRYLGLLRLFFLAVISFYIGFKVLYLDQKYLALETPTGVLYTNLQKPNSSIVLDVHPYCHQYTGPTPSPPLIDQCTCVAWDENDIVYPKDQYGLFITTRVTSQTEQRACNPTTNVCPAPWVRNTHMRPVISDMGFTLAGRDSYVLV